MYKKYNTYMIISNSSVEGTIKRKEYLRITWMTSPSIFYILGYG
jgi:hypothetical protein